MHIRISHETIYHYDTPAKMATQILRLTPRNHDGQYVANWRVDLSENCRLHRSEDAFGNTMHTFTAEGEFQTLRIGVEGVVDTLDTAGVIRGTVERFPPRLFLRTTPTTMPDADIVSFAQTTRASAGQRADKISILHAFLRALHSTIRFDTDPTDVGTTAIEAFALKRGVCQDITHIFIACCRSVGIPARYVSGYFRRNDEVVHQDAGHAWVEAFIDNLGWVAFDPTNGISATDAHVRVAIGLDYLSAAPVRGTQIGGANESLTVAIVVDQARHQMQN
jgi:transglutaminase-like putative cysteine protease